MQPSSIVSPTINDEENEIIQAKGDSAASHHYWRVKDARCLSNITQCNGPSVRLPNNEFISSTQQGLLPLSSKLSHRAKTAKILPKLNSASLISMGQLCDDGCKVVLTKDHLIAVKEDEIILQGKRNQADGLWDIPVVNKQYSRQKKRSRPERPILKPKMRCLYRKNYFRTKNIDYG